MQVSVPLFDTHYAATCENIVIWIILGVRYESFAACDEVCLLTIRKQILL